MELVTNLHQAKGSEAGDLEGHQTGLAHSQGNWPEPRKGVQVKVNSIPGKKGSSHDGILYSMS